MTGRGEWGVEKGRRDAFGRVDILVNSAGTDFLTPALEMSEKGWDAMVRLNLKSHFLCSKAVMGTMIKQGGRKHS
jgi:NAD(P)-dependent dehydrogenase (short-subunit alcohol dehydrogenase family)